jgi:hypothetical protein
MKRFLWGLGCALTLAPGAFAQDRAPAARLGLPAASLGQPGTTIRAQSPEVGTAAAFDWPKVMPRTGGPVPPTTSGSSSASAPGTLPVPGAAPVPTTTGPILTVPPPGPIPSGPVIIDPPGTPFPGGTYVPGGTFTGPLGGEPPFPGVAARASDPSNWYVAAEALMVWVKSYSVPALVTTGPAFSGANLLTTGVTSLYGADTVDVNPRYGGRVTLGYWLSPCWAVELSGFYVRPSSSEFTVLSGDVSTFDLARPFRSANTGAETSEIVGRPGVASGFVKIDGESRLYGAELNARYKYWEGCNNRLHLIGGLRYLHLDEQLTILEQSTGLAGAGPFAGVSRSVTDQFATENVFYGAQIGAVWTYVRGPWTIGLTGKIAAGVTSSNVDINGNVTPLSGGGLPGLPGGLLALNSNIGTYSTRQFSIVPEFGLTLGYDVTSNLRVFAGYNILYWTQVMRPGKAIDRVVDENRIPGFPAAPATSQVRPFNTGATENLWAQGVSLGLMYKW